MALLHGPAQNESLHRSRMRSFVRWICRCYSVVVFHADRSRPIIASSSSVSRSNSADAFRSERAGISENGVPPPRKSLMRLESLTAATTLSNLRALHQSDIAVAALVAK